MKNPLYITTFAFIILPLWFHFSFGGVMPFTQKAYYISINLLTIGHLEAKLAHDMAFSLICPTVPVNSPAHTYLINAYKSYLGISDAHACLLTQYHIMTDTAPVLPHKYLLEMEKLSDVFNWDSFIQATEETMSTFQQISPSQMRFTSNGLISIQSTIENATSLYHIPYDSYATTWPSFNYNFNAALDGVLNDFAGPPTLQRHQSLTDSTFHTTSTFSELSELTSSPFRRGHS